MDWAPEGGGRRPPAGALEPPALPKVAAVAWEGAGEGWPTERAAEGEDAILGEVCLGGKKAESEWTRVSDEPRARV